MTFDRRMYRVAKDLRADDVRRAAEDRRALAVGHSNERHVEAAGPIARRPIFAGLRRLAGLTGWLRA